MGQLPQVVSEKDLTAINDALAHGYEVRMWMNSDGVKIVREKKKVEVIRAPKKN